MIDETRFGTRDARGHYRPAKHLVYPPVLSLPVDVPGFLGWLRGYLFGWNLIYALIAFVFWTWLSPGLAAFENPGPLVVLALLARNAALVLVVFGAYHLRLYMRREQGDRFKYDPAWPAEDSGPFLFRHQTRDNVFWTFASGVPIWTAYEVVMLWAMANDIIPALAWAQHPVAIVVLMMLIPLCREVHFYVTHRLIHTGWLYRHVHSLHHKNRNPGPWSGLAMHPVEHLIYFSGVLLHWIIASHPIHVVYHLVHLGLMPAAGHVGFDKVELGEKGSIDTHCYAHYLHHKHFECNYVDGTVPLDKWFGTFHDGSDESYRRLRERLKRRRAAARGRT